MNKRRITILIIIFVILMALIFAVNYFSSEQIYCFPEQRNSNFCFEIYHPVCGFEGDIRKTYENSCFACSNPEVEYYKEGECLI